MGLFQRIRDDRRRQKATQIKQEIANHLIVNPLCSDYENVFAQVQPLINDMKMVRPFGVGKNGGVLPMTRTPELALLDSPNDEMGWGEFAGAMFATWLTEDELDIHVHLDRGKVRGYTILPPGSKVYNGSGDYYFQTLTEDGVENIYRDEVMTLRFSRSPNKFNQTRKELERDLRGPSNHGKTIYVWRQFNNDTGESMDQVEVRTIQGNNSTLAIKELADIINDHLNKAFGVSNFILGDDSSAKYDNAELSDYQFTRRRVYPALMAFWDQFQFELDRIVGGLGYAIQFKIELPDLTERQKVRAETDEIRVRNITTLIRAGATPADAIKALNLGDNWRGVARGIWMKALIEPTMADKQKLNQKMYDTPLNKSKKSSHNHCCSVNATDELPPMDADELKIYNTLVAMAERIFANTPNIDADGVIEEIERILERRAQLGATDGAERVSKLLKDEAVVAEIRNNIENMQISGTLRDRIHDRTKMLVDRYGESTNEIMNEVLENSAGMSAGEIRKALREAMPTWQAERIARTETVYAFKSGRLDEDETLNRRHNLNLKLIWRARHDGKTCDVCAAMDGETVEVGDAFEHIKETEDGTIAWTPNEWNDDGRIPQPHPNCRCYFDEIVEVK